MIELPRACVRADDVAEYADFFSFGTNDLTQTTLTVNVPPAQLRADRPVMGVGSAVAAWSTKI